VKFTSSPVRLSYECRDSDSNAYLITVIARYDLPDTHEHWIEYLSSVVLSKSDFDKAMNKEGVILLNCGAAAGLALDAIYQMVSDRYPLQESKVVELCS
jgi:hypothetical protein